MNYERPSDPPLLLMCLLGRPRRRGGLRLRDLVASSTICEQAHAIKSNLYNNPLFEGHQMR
jgi:hypothetical protein